MPAIEAASLTKVYRTYKKKPGLKGALAGLFSRDFEYTKAVNEASFQIEEGELIGFLGPNGAGKTTVLKMLAGLLHPTSGSARVLGYEPWKREDAYKRQFALLLGQKNQLWWDLPAQESLELNRQIYEISMADFKSTLGELTELLDVKDKMNVMVRELSLGERMKMELIAALLHRPKVLFLDEPTIGLDVVSQKKVREFLSTYTRECKITTILTSHYMADIQELCKRVIVIDHGRIFFDGRLEEVVDRFANYKIVSFTCETVVPQMDFQSLGEVIEKTSATVKLKVERKNLLNSCREIMNRLPISDLNVQEVPVEDVIRELFSERKQERQQK